MQHSANRMFLDVWQNCCTDGQIPDVASLDSQDLTPFADDMMVVSKTGGKMIFEAVGSRVAKAFEDWSGLSSVLDIYAEPLKPMMQNLIDVVMEHHYGLVRMTRYSFGDHRRRVEMLNLPVKRGDETLMYAHAATFYEEDHGFQLNKGVDEIEHILGVNFLTFGGLSPVDRLTGFTWQILMRMGAVILVDGREIIASGKGLLGDAAPSVSKAARGQLVLCGPVPQLDNYSKAVTGRYDVARVEGPASLETYLQQRAVDVVMATDNGLTRAILGDQLKGLVSNHPDIVFVLFDDKTETEVEAGERLWRVPALLGEYSFRQLMEQLVAHRLEREQLRFISAG